MLGYIRSFQKIWLMIVALFFFGFVHTAYADRAEDLALLGLGTKADQREIETAYKRLVRSTHPDLAGQKAKEWGLPESEIPAIAKRLNDKLALINAAHDRLTGRSEVTPPSTRGSSSESSGSRSSRAQTRSVYRELLNGTPELRAGVFKRNLDHETGQPTADGIRNILYFGIGKEGLNAHEAASLIDSYFSVCKAPCTADRAKLLAAAYTELDQDFAFLGPKLVPINIALGTLLHSIGTEEAYRQLGILQIKSMRIWMKLRTHGSRPQASWFANFHSNLMKDLKRKNPTYRSLNPIQTGGLCMKNVILGVMGF